MLSQVKSMSGYRPVDDSCDSSLWKFPEHWPTCHRDSCCADSGKISAW